MATLGKWLAGLVALAHAGFMFIEMFRWDMFTRRLMGWKDQAIIDRTRVLGANQGLYNGFLAAGLVWGVWTGRTDLLVFFLGCVLVAGVYGGATANTRIYLVQAAPAALALVLILLG